VITTLEFRDRLARRTRRAKAFITVPMLDPLEAYFRLLAQWNAKINLTALPLESPTDETFDRLLVEPLVAAKQIPASASGVWFDLGSGGGSPAIPLKIARPKLQLTMVESKERKSAFLREAIRTLGLHASRVETDRFESIAEQTEFAAAADYVTVRAVRADQDLVNTVGKMLKPRGQLLMFRPAHSAAIDPAGFERVITVPLVETPPSFLSVYRRLFHVEQQ
jgi:16S rRNA (guanine527-N7)-methyltransferase